MRDYTQKLNILPHADTGRHVLCSCFPRLLHTYLEWSARRTADIIRRVPYTKGALGKHWLWEKSYGSNRSLEDAVVASARALEAPLEVLDRNATELYGIQGTSISYRWNTMSADIFYIPAKHRVEFIALSMQFIGEDVHAEVIITSIVGIITKGDRALSLPLKGDWIWGNNRDNTDLWGLSDQGLTDGKLWVHAVKLSRHAKVITTWWNSISCQSEMVNHQ